VTTGEAPAGAEAVLNVTGMTCDDIGRLASAQHITLLELSPQHASLEEAFMEITRDQLAYRSRQPERPGSRERSMA
jgi:ABC-2 type transport system ATP-binding protein